MKLLVLSDAHANPFALRAVLSAEGDLDRVIFAGDHVDYGPFPSETIAVLREVDALCVRGNHDNKLLALRPGDAPGTWGDVNARRMTEDDREWLRARPAWSVFEADGISYLLAHSIGEGYRVPETAYAFDRFAAACGATGIRRMIFGHTHRQCVMTLGGGRVWLNPGSVSYRRPDEPSKDAFYAVVTNGVTELRQVAYDRAPLRAALRALRAELNADEYRVGDFFFDREETDGAMDM